MNNIIVKCKMHIPGYEDSDIEATFTIPVDEEYPLDQFKEWFCTEYNTDNEDVISIDYEAEANTTV